MISSSQYGWLRPIIFIHVFFIAVITAISFRLLDLTLLNELWVFSLFFESNIAVWWSGFCLFIAAVLFYRLFSMATNNYDRIMWFVISMMLVALCLDELASFHERAHLMFDWAGLGVIALTGFVLLLFSLIRLYKGPHSFWTPTLILISLFLFVSVAGMEYLEHNFNFKSAFGTRMRSVAEESVELVATTLFMISAFLEFQRQRINNNNFSLYPSPTKLLFIKEALFVLLIIQMAFLLLFNLEYVPTFPRTRVRGFLVFWYPMICYALCAFYFLDKPSLISKLKRIVLGTLFLVISVSSLFNLSYLYKVFIDTDMSLVLLDSFMFRAVFLCIPLIIAFLWLQLRLGIEMLLLCVVLLVLIYPQSEFRDSFYYLTSTLSFFSFLCLHRYTNQKK